MIVNNNFNMKAIYIAGIVGLLIALGANYLLQSNDPQSQPDSTRSKIKEKTTASIGSDNNPLLHLKITIFKAASDTQEFVRMIGRNEHSDQMIILDGLAKSIKRESAIDVSHAGLLNNTPHALKYGNIVRLATSTEGLGLESHKITEELDQIVRDINEAAYRE